MLTRIVDFFRPIWASTWTGDVAQPVQPPQGVDPDDNFLRTFLRGGNPPHMRHIYTSGPDSYPSRPPRAIVSGGAYELLYRLSDDTGITYLLNLDKPIAHLPIETWRDRASVAARDVRQELLPVCHTAYLQVSTEDHRPRLVHRDGFEAVFTVDGDEVKYYLSGYDEQESPPLYFLCRLPHAVTTVNEARESLKPASVKAALDAGADVKRQGDLFFIPTGLDDVDVRMATNNIVIGDEAKKRLLYGTAHCADGVAHLPGGVMLAKGNVSHCPHLIGQGRSPDHSDLQLPEGWWIVARNTVPASAGRPVTTPSWSASWMGSILSGGIISAPEISDIWNVMIGDVVFSTGEIPTIQPTTSGEEG